MIPKVFVSYAVESENHKEKVYRFVKKLRNQGINVLIFDDMQYGERFTRFMDKIAVCDFVLFICTPEYKRKTEEEYGGVGYEWNIITASVVDKCSEQKYIPVLFSGDWSSSLPVWAVGKKGLDYREESEDELMNLVNAINKYAEICDIEHLEKGIPRRTISVTDDNGIREQYDVVVAFRFKDTGHEYIVYSNDEADREGNVIIYVSKIVQKGGKEILEGIENEEEWERVKNVLWELGQDDDMDDNKNSNIDN